MNLDQSIAGIESPTPIPHLSSIRRAAGVVSFAGKSHQEALTGQKNSFVFDNAAIHSLGNLRCARYPGMSDAAVA